MGLLEAPPVRDQPIPVTKLDVLRNRLLKRDSAAVIKRAKSLKKRNK